MKKLLLLAASLLISATSQADDNSKISMAKIAELSAHRVDRLVTLNKIDATFLKKLEKIEVIRVAGPAPAVYKSVVSQTQPQAGQAFQLELLFDHDGKPLSFKVLADGTAGSDMQWAPKNAVELTENGMHYVLENSTDAAIAPYFKDFSNLNLIKGSLAGKIVALVQVTSSAQAHKLKIYVNLDGSLNSAVIEP